MEQSKQSNWYVRIAAEDEEPPEDADETYFLHTKVRCDECGKSIADKLGVVYNPKEHTIMHKHELEKKELERIDRA